MDQRGERNWTVIGTAVTCLSPILAVSVNEEKLWYIPI